VRSEAGTLAEESIRRTMDGDARGGLRLAQRARELAERDGLPAAQAAAERALGEALLELGEVRAAGEAAERARALDASSDPGGHALGLDENLLGVVLVQIGQPAEAVEVLSSSVSRLEARLGPDDRHTIEALQNLSGATARAGDAGRGEAIGREALERAERALGSDRLTAVILNSLSVRTERDPARADEALLLSRRAAEMAGDALGPSHPLTVRLAANVAIHAVAAGDPGGIERLRDAAAAHEAVLGPDHPDLASVLVALSDAKADPDEARRAIARAVLIRLRALGPTAPPTIRAVRKAVRRFAPDSAGAPVSPEAQEIYRDWAALEPDAVPVPLTLARQRTPDEAGEHLAAVLHRWLGEAPLADEVRNAVADDYLAADAAMADSDYPVAVASIERAIDRIERVRGSGSPELLEPLRRLEVIAAASGEETRMLAIRRRAADITEAAYGAGHPLAAMAMLQFAQWEEREYGVLSPGTAERLARAAREALDERLTAAGTYPELLAKRQSTRIPRTVPLSEARAEALQRIPADGPLAGLDGVDWAGSRHAYGPARDTPGELRLLRSDDPDVRADAADRLAESICHQGSVYPASALAVPFLARLALEPGWPARADAAWLLAMVAAGARRPDAGSEVEAAVLAAVAPHRAALEAAAVDDPRLKDAVTELARALDGAV
jgi:tetratricopeptide (TPR) repeat protein